MDTETFLFLCKETGVTDWDLENRDFGDILDYIDNYLEKKDPDKKPKEKVRLANQNDFDLFAAW